MHCDSEHFILLQTFKLIANPVTDHASPAEMTAWGG